MTAFTWTIVVILGLDVAGKLWAVKTGDMQRTTTGVMADAIANTVLAAWGVALLAGAA